MNKQVIVIEQKVPTCPICSSLMWKRYQDKDVFFICCDDMSHIFKIVDIGQTENEMLVTDNAEVKSEKRLFRDNTWFNSLCTFLYNIFQKCFSFQTTDRNKSCGITECRD